MAVLEAEGMTHLVDDGGKVVGPEIGRRGLGVLAEEHVSGVAAVRLVSLARAFVGGETGLRSLLDRRVLGKAQRRVGGQSGRRLDEGEGGIGADDDEAR